MRFDDFSYLCSLVISGPDVPGVPMADTGAVMQTLVAEARKTILLVGYAIHNGKRLFEPLAKRMADDPALQVTLCIDIGRGHHDTSLPEDVVRRFADEFRTEQWPWPNLPSVYYDPRALAMPGYERASLHAKCVIVDRRAALITSANFTEAAYFRNIEAGALVRHEGTVERLSDYFDGLQAAGHLVQCAICDR
jgi:phosphatidylserine/phosphatidylglycerophosphate/cardiolipin synthase-like enzyme